MSYEAPLKDMLFSMQHLAGIEQVSALPGLEDYGLETASAVLEESSKLCQEVIAPLNVPGDQTPSWFKEGEVFTSPGFNDAFQQYTQGGWQGLGHPAAVGGQGLPKLIATACAEMLHASNMSFALCPMLTDGAIEALLTAASPSQQATYLPKLTSGEWTGTMNLTEPQAGSDLAAVRTRAEPQPDGSYRIFGTKIFITYGEHDMADNIVHLVLARIPGAPDGVKGISLFLVPKYVVNPDGSLGNRNDVQCVSIEHKLGIKASPTAVLQFGDQGGAVGELVGEAHQGLKYMFIMMNSARFAVGMQGIGISDRAFQQALAYARDRIQGKGADGVGSAVAIVEHPDVKRMLLSMKASTEGARALAYVAAAAADAAHHAEDAATRSEQLAFYEFLVPVVKGHATELAVEVTSLGVQVHGGMGFIEETGAAQHYRDARILPIYEGTTAIQANDLVGRKTLRDKGATARSICRQIVATEQALALLQDADAHVMGEALAAGRKAFESSIDFLLQNASRPQVIFAGAVPYLRLAGYVLCGWQMARAMEASLRLRSQDPQFFESKVLTARFYAESLLPLASALENAIRHSGPTLERMSADLL